MKIRIPLSFCDVVNSQESFGYLPLWLRNYHQLAQKPLRSKVKAHPCVRGGDFYFARR